MSPPAHTQMLCGETHRRRKWDGLESIIGLQDLIEIFMFGLFKRKKIEAWELEFLKEVFTKMQNSEYKKFCPQIESGLLKGVLMGMSDIPNYVGFTYDTSLYNKFYDAQGKNFKLTSIKVRNTYSNEFLLISIYFAFGMINGYSIDNKVSKYKFDNNEINVSSVRKIYIGDENIDLVLSLLTPKERSLINESEIYVSVIDDKDYYHLKELDDGDFIAINQDNNIYRISHDPFEIFPIERSRLIDYILK